MRSLKFRAWNTAAKTWQTEWVAIGMNGEKMSKMPDGSFQVNEGVALEYQQFTGLHDKAGREVYEGDIIMIDAVDFSHRFPEKIDDIFKAHNLVGEPSSHWEIIGNIYENPELLNPLTNNKA